MRFVAAIAFALLVAPALAQDIRVIDGDTFEMDGEIIRLWGIDAPEMDQTCERDGETREVGGWIQTDQRGLPYLLQDLLYCERQNTDRYGRTIARCFVENRNGVAVDVAEILVIYGLAWDYEQYSESHYARPQSLAQRLGWGVWAFDCIPPWEWREQN